MSRLHQALKVAARYAEKVAACSCENGPEASISRPTPTAEEQKPVAVTPPGWEGPVKEMKKHPDKVDNPWAVAWWMKDKGYKPHKK